MIAKLRTIVPWWTAARQVHSVRTRSTLQKMTKLIVFDDLRHGSESPNEVAYLQ